MSGLERTSLILDKIIQFIHLLLHNICYGVTFSGNWLHNKAVARKKFLGGGGGGGGTCLLCPCLFCKVTSICFVL